MGCAQLLQHLELQREFIRQTENNTLRVMTHIEHIKMDISTAYQKMHLATGAARDEDFEDVANYFKRIYEVVKEDAGARDWNDPV